MQRKRVAEATKGAGKPLVGGPFELLDQHGNKFTHEDLKGRYSLVRKKSMIREIRSSPDVRSLR